MKKRVPPSTLDAAPRFTGIDPATLCDADKTAIVALALAVLKERYRPGALLTSAAATREYLQLLLSEAKHELFGVLFLDTRNRLLAAETLFQGTIDGASVYPRVVVQRAFELNAAAVILYHNHPSGIAEPSRSDEALTRRLKEALALVDIRVLDHLVVGAGETVSFAELGLL